MKRNYSGCALCDATWGDYWREVEGENMFFCCNVCADAFENMVLKLKEVTRWPAVGSVEISGNYSKGRTCNASSPDGDNVKYFFRHENGDITEFKLLSTTHD